MDQLSQIWYTWGSFLALAVALLAAFGVFFDAWRKQVDALIWKTLGFLAVVLIAPSVVIAVVPELQRTLASALLLFAIVGLVSILLALFALVMQVAGVGASAGTNCPNCGKPRDPSWPFCPYCQYDKPAPQPLPPVMYTPPPPPPPVMYTPPPPTPAQGVPVITSAPDVPTQVDLPSAPSSPPAGSTRLLQTVKSPMPLAYLIVRTGVHQGKTFQLGENTSIGRKADLNDIVLDNDAISRQHARVRFEGGKFVLYDLASANGTFIQDPKTEEWKKVQHRQLTEGMSIKLGETVLVFMIVQGNKEE
jgi:hypothetical protein